MTFVTRSTMYLKSLEKNSSIVFCKKKLFNHLFHWKRNVVILFWLPKNNSIHLCAKFACVVYKKKRERERTPEKKRKYPVALFHRKRDNDGCGKLSLLARTNVLQMRPERAWLIVYIYVSTIHIGVYVDTFLRERNKISRPPGLTRVKSIKCFHTNAYWTDAIKAVSSATNIPDCICIHIYRLVSSVKQKIRLFIRIFKPVPLFSIRVNFYSRILETSARMNNRRLSDATAVTARLFVKPNIPCTVDFAARARRTRMQLQTGARIFQIFDFDCNATILLSRSRVRFLWLQPYRSTDRTGPERRTDRRKYEQFFRLFFSPGVFVSPREKKGGAFRAKEEGEREQKARAEGGRKGGRYRVTPFKRGYRFDTERAESQTRTHFALQNEQTNQRPGSRVRPGYIRESLWSRRRYPKPTSVTYVTRLWYQIVTLHRNRRDGATRWTLRRRMMRVRGIEGGWGGCIICWREKERAARDFNGTRVKIYHRFVDVSAHFPFRKVYLKCRN